MNHFNDVRNRSLNYEQWECYTRIFMVRFPHRTRIESESIQIHFLPLASVIIVKCQLQSAITINHFTRVRFISAWKMKN